MRTFAAGPGLLLLASILAFAADSQDASSPPAWYLDEIATLASGSGRWVTDNAEYMSEQEPYDFYVTEWKASFDGVTMTGRLFGIRDGKETGNFWEFRQYWHPQRKEAIVEQFGWGGTVGLGTIWRQGEVSKSKQNFFSADGTSSVTGHVSFFPDADTHVTESFDIEGDVWTPRRSYTWHLASPAE